jgi:hypothetical protein
VVARRQGFLKHIFAFHSISPVDVQIADRAGKAHGIAAIRTGREADNEYFLELQPMLTSAHVVLMLRSMYSASP